MEFDAWHHWLLLRPLIIFVLACPLLIGAVLIGRRQDRRDAKRAGVPETNADRRPAGCEDAESRGYEVVQSTSREWNGPPSHARRAA